MEHLPELAHVTAALLRILRRAMVLTTVARQRCPALSRRMFREINHCVIKVFYVGEMAGQAVARSTIPSRARRIAALLRILWRATVWTTVARQRIRSRAVIRRGQSIHAMHAIHREC